MRLGELKRLLNENPYKHFQLKLPNDQKVPQSFHITEVGLVSKKFIDCGGKIHAISRCQLQVWIGPDVDHRIETEKMAQILQISESIVSDDSLEVEIEYEDSIISQYPVAEAQVNKDSVMLVLSLKHTDCLAKELCLPKSVTSSGCCGGGACC